MENKEIKISIDKDLDLLTAFVNEKKSDNSLTAIDSGNIIFYVEPETNELIMVQIYDFNVLRKKLFKNLMVLATKGAINAWLNSIISAFQASNTLTNKYAH